MKNQPRNPRIEYGGMPSVSKAAKQEPPKKGFIARHPLISGAVVAVAIGIGGAFALSGESKTEKETHSKLESRREQRQKNKEKRLRRQVERIRKTIEVQKRLIEQGWYEGQDENARNEIREAETEFLLELEDKTKGELVEILLAQNRIIVQLREENDTDTLPHEENKLGIVQQKLDEIEIVERGLLEKSVVELEYLLAELDKIIVDAESQYVEFDAFMDAMEERVLVVKALEEKKFWEDAFFSPNV